MSSVLRELLSLVLLSSRLLSNRVRRSRPPTALRPIAHRVARLAGDRGQTTAEYALVMLGGAAVAMLLFTWATNTDVLGTLFSFVIDKVMGLFG